MTRFSAIAYAMKSQSVGFKLFVDDQLIAECERAGIERLDDDLPNDGKTLTLVTESLGRTHFDHAFWCYPRFKRARAMRPRR